MNLQEALYLAIGLVIGVVLHEYMHGRVADLCGDRTARNAGRLTLNPIPHIDPFGTVLLPLALLLFSGGSWMFGYAKPVPVNPYFMKKPKRDMVLVALSGPVTNFMVAAFFVLTGYMLRVAGANPASGGFVSEVFLLFAVAAGLNVFLGIFNLIPIPPLDGSHVVEYFLSPRARQRYESVAPFGFALILLFFVILRPAINAILIPILGLIERILGI